MTLARQEAVRISVELRNSAAKPTSSRARLRTGSMGVRVAVEDWGYRPTAQVANYATTLSWSHLSKAAQQGKIFFPVVLVYYFLLWLEINFDATSIPTDINGG